MCVCVREIVNEKGSSSVIERGRGREGGRGKERERVPSFKKFTFKKF